MPTYFGNTTPGGSYLTGGPAWMRNKNYITGFTCPGSGNQQVKEISVYSMRGAVGQYIRIAVYDTSHNLVCQGSGKVALPSSAAWTGHMSADEITPNPCNLIGGIQYDLALSTDAATARIYYSSGGSYGDYTFNVVDYTGGFPSTLADASDSNYRANIRCGVDPAGGTYQEDLTSIAASASSIEDIQKFIQVLDSVIQSQSTLVDLQNYLQILDSLMQSQSTLADLQTYKETLDSLIQSTSDVTDTKSLVEDLQSTIASISALMDIQNYVHMLDSVAQSAITLSDFQNYIDIVVSTAQSISSIADFKIYMEILDSIATSVSTITDTIVLAEALETLIQSEATLTDIQHYFETLLTTIISEASVTDVLSGQYVEELLATIISESGVYDYYQKPGMIETTPPFYLASKKEFQFGKAIESFYTGGPIPQFIIKEAEGFYMGKSVPQFIVEKRYGATA